MNKLFLTGAFSCVAVLSALAQTSTSATQITPSSTATASPAHGIGPAPVHTKQHQILDGALSSQTRQTLQEAMNSAPASSAK